ncbi:hypothetical protein ACFPN1_14645 [Lysobacter yangpyeongensis]|uniref:Membrane-anchored protein n=1 Tax=Lysobacter yangpyeongensis TaxID=346182 RepID=A0ABW0SQE4_9GAMM
MITDSTKSPAALAKVPEITLGFWALKVLATTLGETGGDAVSMSMGLGYLVGTGLFMALFVLAIAAQVAARGFHPLRYWGAIIASTMVGTTLADFADRSLGIGYPGGSLLLLGLLLATLAAWHRAIGSVDVRSVGTPGGECFYWLTILFSQTLGTALGDWTADTAGLGYVGAMFVFGGLLLMVTALYVWSRIPRTALFWTAFILTRPLGAVVGDFLDKPVAQGGLALSRYTATLVLLGLIAVGIALLPQRAARSAH